MKLFLPFHPPRKSFGAINVLEYRMFGYTLMVPVNQKQS